MAVLRYATHPDVRVSADIPVPFWGLSDIGRRRAGALARQPWLDGTRRLLSSAETKALETAAIVASATGLPIEVREALHENDRSATGFVPPDRFEALADAFFGAPHESVEGWETSADAQRRVVTATADLFEPGVTTGDVLVVGHGAVGTLLLCHLLNIAITRNEDQTWGDAAPGGGNAWAYDLEQRSLLHRWRPIDVLFER